MQTKASFKQAVAQEYRWDRLRFSSPLPPPTLTIQPFKAGMQGPLFSLGFPGQNLPGPRFPVSMAAGPRGLGLCVLCLRVGSPLFIPQVAEHLPMCQPWVRNTCVRGFLAKGADSTPQEETFHYRQGSVTAPVRVQRQRRLGDRVGAGHGETSPCLSSEALIRAGGRARLGTPSEHRAWPWPPLAHLPSHADLPSVPTRSPLR